jgi:hypothetical protein
LHSGGEAAEHPVNPLPRQDGSIPARQLDTVRGKGRVELTLPTLLRVPLNETVPGQEHQVPRTVHRAMLSHPPRLGSDPPVTPPRPLRDEVDVLAQRGERLDVPHRLLDREQVIEPIIDQAAVMDVIMKYPYASFRTHSHA